MSLRRKARQFTKAPVQTQARLLRRLLRDASQTEWGRRYNYAAIADQQNVIKAYQQAVPLHSYNDIATDVQRARKGEENILCPGRIRHFAVSSGTASEGRILPLSQEMVRRNTAFGFGVALQYMRTTRNFRVLLGRQVSMPGRIEEDRQYPGSFIGEVSGFLLEAVPPQFRFMYRNIPREIAFLPHWHEKLAAVIDYALDHDIRVIATVPSWALSMFKMTIDCHNRQQGTAVRTVGEIWPNLQLFVSGGVALSSYRAVLEELIGLPNMHFLETYGASEGFFSYQVALDDPAMLLHLNNGIFFEFVHFDEMYTSSPRRYHIGEVEPNVRYVPYVTTCSGLWAYPVGDVLRFTSTRPHKIEVAGRTSEVLDRYGEKVFGEDARQTIEHACRETDTHIAEYHLTSRPPTVDDMPRIEWLVEFASPPASLSDFATLLDSTLCEINRHYQVRRQSGSFAAPLLTPLSSGTFAAWLQASRKHVSTQTKIRRMSEDTTIANALIAVDHERYGTPEERRRDSSAS